MKIYIYTCIFIITYILAGCNNDKSKIINSENNHESPKGASDLRNRIKIKVLTDQKGLVEKTTIVNSRFIGTEYRAKSKIKKYSSDFSNGSVIKFKSSVAELHIECDGPSAFGSWPFFPGGSLVFPDGSVKKVISDTGAGGKSIDNNKFVSEIFLESDESLKKYGFKLVLFRIIEM